MELTILTHQGLVSKEVVEFISSLNDDCEVETIAGEQDVYSYIIAVE